MSQKLKDILVVLLLVAIFVVVLLKVEHCKPVNNDNITNSDTVTITKSDTVWAKDTLYIYDGTPTLTDSFYIHDTVDVDLCNYMREYKDTINDTNITIYTDNLVRGKLIESGLSYKLKIPIKITDSVITTITNTKEPKTQLYTGLTLSKNIIAPMVGIQRNSLYLHAGYNIVEKQPIISFGYRFYSK